MTSPDPFAPPPAGGAQPPPAPGYGSPYSQPYGPPQGYGAPPPDPGGWQGQPQTETKAMVALGLAIAAYTPAMPFIGAIVAIVLARMARRDILASGGAKTGLNLCTWATVLSWFHLVAITLLVLLFFAAFLLPLSLST